jgi:23S rRNA pseudouridine1911/1915/1917 synthase
MSEDLHKFINITVDRGQKKERLDKFLTHQVENLTRSKIQELISDGYVSINNKLAKSSHQISPDEQIQIILPIKNHELSNKPENIPLDIIYEDEYLLVVNKPAGMVTHPAFGNYSGTLVNALLFHSQSLSSSSDGQRPGIVHRLDKGTSGLLVIAKNDFIHHKLSLQFLDRLVEKEYHAIVWGVFSDKNKYAKTGSIETFLNRSKKDRKKITVSDVGKNAITYYEVLQEFDNFSHIKLLIKTGRTHQIRVHLSHINHPVFGDPDYSGRRIVYGNPTSKYKAFIENLLELTPYQLLHSKSIGFIHPVTHQKVRFDSELPDNFQNVLHKIKKWTNSL